MFIFTGSNKPVILNVYINKLTSLNIYTYNNSLGETNVENSRLLNDLTCCGV